MNREQRERLVDSALDRALSPPSEEPRPGFEDRLLANLAAQPARRPWWRWVWIPVLAAAAVVAIVFGIQAMRSSVPTTIETKQNPPHPAQTPTTVAKAPDQSQRSGTSPAHTAPKRVEGRELAKVHAPHMNGGIQRNALLPKVVRTDHSKPFPPAPLTESERALLAMLHQNPNEAGLLAERQQERNKQAEQYMEQAFGTTTQPQR